jgi:3-dehydroquinate synthase
VTAAGAAGGAIVVEVPVAGGAYPVVVGPGARAGLADLLDPGARRVAVVTQAGIDLDVDVGREHRVFLVGDGEPAKSLATVEELCRAWSRWGLTRADQVVAVGGGVVTDTAGFAAAVYHRGVAVVHVPTTLLGMVDAAVGGKTGINTRSGKNLVGAFHEPAGVLCDLSLLRSLPRAELVAGLGEVVKCGFIADPVILDLVEDHDAGTITADSPVLRELVERAVRVKVDVVTADLRETGGTGGHPGREVLNYGHTMAHAIERTENYRIRHGEAVSIGCVYVAELAARAGTLAPDVVERHHQTFAHVGLPTTYSKASFDDLHRAMKVDKKSRGSQLRFVVLAELAVPTVLAGPSEVDLRDAYAAIGGHR